MLVRSDRMATQATVGDAGLWGLDDSVEQVGAPCLRARGEEQRLEQCRGRAHGVRGESEIPGKAVEVQQRGGPGCDGGEQPPDVRSVVNLGDRAQVALNDRVEVLS